MSEPAVARDPYHQRVDPRVQCDTCEAVCCRLTVVLFPDDRVPGWLVHEDARGLRTLAKSPDGWCAAMDRDNFRCGIYEDRPSICRRFAMGGPSCRHERDAWRDGRRAEAAEAAAAAIR